MNPANEQLALFTTGQLDFLMLLNDQESYDKTKATAINFFQNWFNSSEGLAFINDHVLKCNEFPRGGGPMRQLITA